MIDIPVVDIVAILFFVAAWIGYGTLISRLAGTGRSLSSAMDFQRRQWMRVMARLLVDYLTLSNQNRSPR